MQLAVSKWLIAAVLAEQVVLVATAQQTGAPASLTGDPDFERLVAEPAMRLIR